jgi:hypothetical protein
VGPRSVLSALAVVLTLVAAPAAHGAGLRLGFTDENAFARATDGDAALDLQRVAGAGGSVVRFELKWRAVAPAAPPDDATARDPGWSGYDWSGVDQTVRRIRAAGLDPLPIVHSAPAWAEGPGRATDARSGTWNPSAAAYGAFAVALARRYSGTYPDPTGAGGALPAVRSWQVWNEPNLSNFLGPQWTSARKPNSPALYRGLLNAFYAGVKSVSAKNVVVTAGTAPFGDLKAGDPRMPPALFWRTLLCVKQAKGKLVSTRCTTKVRFDAAAHHPYPIGPPDRKARNADDMVVPDLGKLTKPLAVALKAGTVLPRKPKQLWATEISWDSRPDPDGLTADLQARYLEGALYTLWRQGVDVVTWWLLRDDAPKPSYAATYQSGIFFRGATPAEDTPKPSYTAFRFPFTAYRSRGVAQLWGMVPPTSAGKRTTVVIEAKQGSRWVQAVRLTAGTNRMFTGRLTVGRRTQLRAVVGADASLPWTVS